MWDYGDSASLVMEDNPATTTGLKTFSDAVTYTHMSAHISLSLSLSVTTYETASRFSYTSFKTIQDSC